MPRLDLANTMFVQGAGGDGDDDDDDDLLERTPKGRVLKRSGADDNLGSLNKTDMSSLLDTPGAGKEGTLFEGHDTQHASLPGLLISYLTIMDFDETRLLTHERWKACASALEFDTEDHEWEELMGRYGHRDEDLADHLDIHLIAGWFCTHHTVVLEKMLRRFLRGMVSMRKQLDHLEKEQKEHGEQLAAMSARVEAERNHKMQRVLREWKYKILMPVWLEWKGVLGEKRAAALKAAKRWAGGLLTKTFYALRENVAMVHAQKDAVATAARRWKYRAYANCFLAWRDDVRREREMRLSQLQKSVGRMLNRQVTMCFFPWVELTRRQLRAKQLAEEMGAKKFEFLRLNTLRQNIVAWHDFIFRELDHRETVVASAVALRGKQTLTTCLRAWRTEVRSAIELRAQQNRKAILRLRNRVAFGAFEAWRDFLRMKRAVLKKAAYAIGPGRLLAVCLRTWAVNVAEAKEEAARQKMVRVVLAEVPQLINEAFERLVPRMVAEQEKRSMREEMLQTMLQTISTLTSEVRHMQREQARAAAVVEREQSNQQKRVLREWKRRCLRPAMAAWKALLEAKHHAIRRAASRWMGGLLAKTFGAWRGVVGAMHRQQWAVAAAVRRMQNRVVCNCFVAWRDDVWEVLEERAIILRKSAGRIMHRSTAAIFDPWLALTRTKKRARERAEILARQAARRRRQEAMVGVCGAWRDHVRRLSEHRERVVERATAVRARASEYRVVLGWKAEVRANLEERKLKGHKALARFAMRTAALAFDAWCDFLIYKRNVLGRAAYHIGPGRLQAACFRTWAANYRQAQHNRYVERLAIDLQAAGPAFLLQALGDIIPSLLPAASPLHEREAIGPVVPHIPGHTPGSGSCSTSESHRFEVGASGSLLPTSPQAPRVSRGHSPRPQSRGAAGRDSSQSTGAAAPRQPGGGSGGGGEPPLTHPSFRRPNEPSFRMTAGGGAEERGAAAGTAVAWASPQPSPRLPSSPPLPAIGASASEFADAVFAPLAAANGNGSPGDAVAAAMAAATAESDERWGSARAARAQVLRGLESLLEDSGLATAERVMALARSIDAHAHRLEDGAAQTARGLIICREESRSRDATIEVELQKLQRLVAAQTKAYVAAFAQKKRKDVQLEGQLHTLLSTVTGIAHKLHSVDEQTLQTKDALHKIISRRSVFIL